jgi:hypothetical protein
MVLDPCLVALAHEAEGAYGSGRDELHRQDGVNLADELVADLDGRFGNGTAKLEDGQRHWAGCHRIVRGGAGA